MMWPNMLIILYIIIIMHYEYADEYDDESMIRVWLEGDDQNMIIRLGDENKFSMIIFQITGDFPPHDVWQQSRDSNLMRCHSKI